MPDPLALIRPHLRDLEGYTPGEQPDSPGLIKLNTNENPYGPVRRVTRAIKKATDNRLRLYPNPTAQRLREKLAARHGCRTENIIVGNGSDELLALATRAFVEPWAAVADGGVAAEHSASRHRVQFFHPGYSLYPILARIHGAVAHPIALGTDFSIPSPEVLEREGGVDWEAALTFVTTPNAPSGRAYTVEELEAFCRRQRGVVVLDEAYVEFAQHSAIELARRCPHVVVSRTFSKAFSLCFQRIGYFVGNPELIRALDKIRDSYNVNGLGQVAAEATLDNLEDYRVHFERITSAREKLTRDLIGLGFDVLPSETNFVLARPPVGSAEAWLEALRRRNILVRWFSQSEVRDRLRITVGTPDQMRELVRRVEEILNDVKMA